jgi:protein TonB
MKRALLLLMGLFVAATVRAQSNHSTKVIDSSENIGEKPPYDIAPVPRGGLKAFGKYLHKNLRWPKDEDATIGGRVIISFTVEKSGTLKNLKIIRGLSPLLDKEALRVLEKSSPWIPAQKNGMPISVLYYIPVSFSVEENN